MTPRIGCIHNRGDDMRNKLITAGMTAAVAVALIGGGVALGASTNHAVKACSKKSSHALGLLKNGKCAKGSTEVTLGARGPRGKRGPGAVSYTLTGGNNDLQVTFPNAIDGMTIATNCGMASGVNLAVEPTTGTLDASGTGSEDGAITPIDGFNAANVGQSGVNQADLDIVASANNGAFVRLDIHGTWSGDACHYWLVATPATAAG
jgi:hypothetical protein